MASDDDLVRACPGCDHCGSFAIRTGRRRHQYKGDPDKKYRCDKCGECFDEPVVRPAKGNRSGGPRVVSDADLEAARRALGIEGGE